jgi:urease accessory protein
MLTISQRASAGSDTADVQLVLPFALRSRSRLRTALATGEEVGLLLNRGTVLRGGDRLLAEDGRIVEIVAEAETVSMVRSHDLGLLCRASYHLGNRHVALQIGEGGLCYLHDHVLDDMVRGLGLTVTLEQAPFEPEAGAYSAAAHSLLHVHGHSHPHS